MEDRLEDPQFSDCKADGAVGNFSDESGFSEHIKLVKLCKLETSRAPILFVWHINSVKSVQFETSNDVSLFTPQRNVFNLVKFDKSNEVRLFLLHLRSSRFVDVKTKELSLLPLQYNVTKLFGVLKDVNWLV